jgi:hypothetical protein
LVASVQRLFTVLVLGVALLSGCADGADRVAGGAPSILAHEAASYEAFNSVGELVALFRAEYVANSTEQIDARVSVQMMTFSAGGHVDLRGPYKYALDLDVSTGQILSVSGADNIVRYPLGVHAFAPDPTALLARKVTPGAMDASFARAFWPFSLQWAALDLPHSPEVAWGPLRVGVSTTPGGWQVTSIIKCGFDCPGQGPGEAPPAWRAFMRGNASRLLPESVWFEDEGGLVVLEIRAVDHQVGPSIDTVPPVAPPPGPAPTTRATCGLAPCEGPDWPASFSLTAGAEALARDPRFIAWIATNPEYRQQAIVVAPGSLTILGSATLPGSLWIFQFVDPASGALVRWELAGTTAGAPGDAWTGFVIDGPVDAGRATGRYSAVAGLAYVLPPDAVILDGLASFGFTPADIRIVSLGLGPEAEFPDLGGQVRWGVDVVEPDGSAGLVWSASLGTRIATAGLG